MSEEEKQNMLEITREHSIMKRIIVENGLWETLLNDDEFNKYLREEYEGRDFIDDTKCLKCGEGTPAYCEECMQKVIAENARLQKESVRYRTYKEYLETKGE